MLLVRCATGLCLIFLLQQSLAETETVSEASTDKELDEEFLEIMGSVDVEGDEWFEIFLSTIDEVDKDYPEQNTKHAEYD